MAASRAEPTRVTIVAGGPMLVEGPVEVVQPDGEILRCDRPLVALCTCRRSGRLPFCDTSHRRRRRHPADDQSSSTASPPSSDV